MKKSFIIIMLVLSIGLIGFGIFLGINDKSEKVYEGIVDVEAVSIGDQTLRKHENFKMDLREIDKHFEEVHNHFKKYIPM